MARRGRWAWLVLLAVVLLDVSWEVDSLWRLIPAAFGGALFVLSLVRLTTPGDIS